MRKILLGCAALVLLAEGVAQADAHHQLLSHSAIHDSNNQIVGFKARVLLDPQRLTSNNATFGGDVRLALGGLKYDRTKAVAGQYNHHRDAVAGAAQGYVLHQFKMREVTGPNPGDLGPHTETMQTGGQMKEVEVEVHYKDNPNLVPGSHVDLVAGFWKGSYWHVWGAADSPTQSSRDFVLQLPGTPSKAFLEAQLLTLDTQLVKAKADVTAATSALTAAQKTHATAQTAYNAMQTARQAPQQALQQANAAASLAYQNATRGPQATYNAAVQANQVAYQNATRAAQAAYSQAIAAAQAAQRAGGPNAYNTYLAAYRAAQATLNQVTQPASQKLQQANAAANAALQQATNAARATYNQATQAAQATYQAAINSSTINHTTITQQWSAASTGLSTATAAKTNADAALKTLTDKIADYQKMLASMSTPAQVASAQ